MKMVKKSNKNKPKKEDGESSSEEEAVHIESFKSLQYKSSDKDQIFYNLLNQVIRVKDFYG